MRRMVPPNIRFECDSNDMSHMKSMKSMTPYGKTHCDINRKCILPNMIGWLPMCYQFIFQFLGSLMIKVKLLKESGRLFCCFAEGTQEYKENLSFIHLKFLYTPSCRILSAKFKDRIIRCCIFTQMRILPSKQNFICDKLNLYVITNDQSFCCETKLRS